MYKRNHFMYACGCSYAYILCLSNLNIFIIVNWCKVYNNMRVLYKHQQSVCLQLLHTFLYVRTHIIMIDANIYILKDHLPVRYSNKGQLLLNFLLPRSKRCQVTLPFFLNAVYTKHEKICQHQHLDHTVE